MKITSPKIRHQNGVTKNLHFQAPSLANLGLGKGKTAKLQDQDKDHLLVARPLSYKTKIKTTYFFKTKTDQAKTKTTFQDQDRFFKRPSKY